MTSYAVYLQMQPELHQRFKQVTQLINTPNAPRQAKVLGVILADLACAVLDQVFTELIRKVDQLEAEKVDRHGRESSQQVIDKIAGYIQHYMPYAVSFFNNQRLIPLVNYLDEWMREHEGKDYLIYEINDLLAEQQIQCLNQIRAGEDLAVKQGFANLVQIIDVGVQALIVQPKTTLKFNFLVNKTLDGVIHMCTQIGYQRLEKVTSNLTALRAAPYLDHFFSFLHKQQQKQLSLNNKDNDTCKNMV
ncbi:hypothetical protein [Acinetobacter rudis]|uniref:Uncharacterized protein n=1 Tax=Acinetobacter rudis TaxID=632955 RepID=A0AAW8J5B5_9GAMM|nr:hypothetical protein [Acinetobacter rudis]MDQ8934558.1 hypothetical protein [Acinetobacter rudis]MDQ8951675.1 hypothetical protein [Acinetobacter rudis]MDQ9016872.1 hypothetical protein [Acinetobacter rudis]